MRTSNPALNDNIFVADTTHASETMTVAGTVNKSFILLALLMSTAYWAWFQLMPAGGNEVNVNLLTQTLSWLGAALLGTFIIAIVIIFKKSWAPFLAPVYALLEGALLGAISVTFELRYPGIAFQAVGLTMGIFLALLTAYKSGLIKATENFKLGVAAATGGICLVYIINLVLSFFGMSVPFLHDASPIGIGISLFIVGIAALNLVLDFDFIETEKREAHPSIWSGMRPLAF